MADCAYWKQRLDALIAELDSGPSGISSAQARHRLTEYGPNDATIRPRRPAWLRFLQRFTNPLLIILLCASAISAATGDIASFIIVVTIILLSVVMDFVQEMRAQNAVDALQAKVALHAHVMRDGKATTVRVTELVPGDIVKLGPGNLVPADGRLLDAADFFVNEALLTGESYPAEKHPVDIPKPVNDALSAEGVVFAGTTVISGSATLLVTATGARTALGALASSLAGKPPTAFETGLNRFSGLLLRITVLLVLFVLTESLWFKRDWLESLLFALALAVGLTPALLPMIVTVTLGRGALRMAQRRVIVKRLSAIHNLGAMDVLCTDKTGTLTEANVRMVRAADVSGTENRRVFELAWLNSHFQTGLKNPMDDAILKHGRTDDGAWRKLDEVPFDFERRRASVLLENSGERMLIVKGAPEDMLRLSTAAERPDGSISALTSAECATLGAEFERFGMEGCRALGIAYRKAAPDQSSANANDERELVFAGFAVFLDPPKPSSATAIHALAQDGVAVKILTGDNERVAQHLCGQLGIRVQSMMTGEQLDRLSDEALSVRSGRTNLFCRVTPPQKLRVLLALRRVGKTVAFLGDGINDAPALNAADVGISVDSGTDVAKAAAEIVLLERDLGVLHAGVMEGRRTVINVDKYILMASSANFGNIISMALAGLFLPFLPLLPIQVLLTNLLYDVAQTGLPFDYVDHEEIARPVHWNIQLIERFMLIVGPISTLFDAMTFVVLLLLLQANQGQFRTGWFIESLATQILAVFAIRTRRSMFASRPHPAVTLLAAVLAILSVALPFLPIGPWFTFVELPWPYFVFLALALTAFLAMVETTKRWFYRRFAHATSI